VYLGQIIQEEIKFARPLEAKAPKKDPHFSDDQNIFLVILKKETSGWNSCKKQMIFITLLIKLEMKERGLTFI
jgi:hypothetical protein